MATPAPLIPHEEDIFPDMAAAMAALENIVKRTDNAPWRSTDLDRWLTRFAATMEQPGDDAPRPDVKQASAIYSALRVERPQEPEIAERVKTTIKWVRTMFDLARGDSSIPYYSLSAALDELTQPDLNGLLKADSIKLTTSEPNQTKGRGK